MSEKGFVKPSFKPGAFQSSVHFFCAYGFGNLVILSFGLIAFRKLFLGHFEYCENSRAFLTGFVTIPAERKMSKQGKEANDECEFLEDRVHNFKK